MREHKSKDPPVVWAASICNETGAASSVQNTHMTVYNTSEFDYNVTPVKTGSVFDSRGRLRDYQPSAPLMNSQLGNIKADLHKGGWEEEFTQKEADGLLRKREIKRKKRKRGIDLLTQDHLSSPRHDTSEPFDSINGDIDIYKMCCRDAISNTNGSSLMHDKHTVLWIRHWLCSAYEFQLFQMDSLTVKIFKICKLGRAI